MSSRAPLLLLSLLSLNACAINNEAAINPQKFLESFDGPKVSSVNDTILKSAQDAETNGEYANAATLYKQLLDSKPDSVEYATAVANNLRRAGELDLALALYDGILAKAPKNLDIKEGKGITLLLKADFDNAGRVLTEVMREDPKRWRTLNAIGILFATKKMYKEAQLYYNEALKYSPNTAAVYNNFGLTLALNHEYDRAIATLMQASSSVPTKSNERKRIDLNMAMVYASAGRLADAEKVAQQYYSGPALKNNMGFYAHMATNEALANTYLNMALTESKTFYERAWKNLDMMGAPAGASPRAGNKTLPFPTEMSPTPPVEEAPEKTSEKSGRKKSAKSNISQTKEAEAAAPVAVPQSISTPDGHAAKPERPPFSIGSSVNVQSPPIGNSVMSVPVDAVTSAPVDAPAPAIAATNNAVPLAAGTTAVTPSAQGNTAESLPLLAPSTADNAAATPITENTTTNTAPAPAAGEVKKNETTLQKITNWFGFAR